MRQLFTSKPVRYALISFFAVDTAKYLVWSLVYERMLNAERSNLEINLFFIFYCGIVAAVVAFLPLALKKLRLGSPRASTLIYRTSAAASLVFLIFSAFLPVGLIMIFGLFTMLFLSVCVSLRLSQLTAVLPQNLSGRFLGVVYAAYMLVSGGVEAFSGTGPAFFAVAFTALFTLLLLSVLFFRAHPASAAAPRYEAPRPPGLASFFALLPVPVVLFSAVLNSSENFAFFGSYFEPYNVYLIVYFVFYSLMYLLNGLFLDKYGVRVSLLLPVLLIIAAYSTHWFWGSLAQTLPFKAFVPITWTLFEMTVVSIYLYRSKIRVLSGLGYALMYLGYCLASVLFQLTPENGYAYINGAMLLLSVLTLILLMLALAGQHGRPEERLAEACDNTPDSPPPAQSPSLALFAEGKSLTKRETELLPFVLSAKTAEEIAAENNLSYSTVRFHISNILTKTGADNRRELRRIYSQEPELTGVSVSAKKEI